MLAESPDTPPHAGEPVSGNLSFAYPLEQRARLHLQVLRGLNCGKPFGFHVSLFSHSGNAGSRRFVDGYVVFLSSLRIKLLRILVASTSDLVEQVMGAVLTPSLLLTTRSLSPHIALSYKGTSGFIAKCLRCLRTRCRRLCSPFTNLRLPTPSQLPYSVSSCIPTTLLR